jgi:GH15 family glucan-1,4-alpha-glucosidase
LREYALIADGERGVLVGSHGEMVWGCFPRWDSPALFASLIGGGGGYSVTPADRHVWGGSYEPDSLIWRNRWMTDAGVVECRDALALPGAPSEMTVLRRIHSERAGTVRVVLALRTDFGRRGVSRLRQGDDGSWSGQLGDLRFHWSGAPGARVVDDGRHHDLELDLHLEPGASHDLVLTVTAGHEIAVVDVDRAWAGTLEGWRRRAVQPSSIAERDVRHAHAVLTGLTSNSGAMVAAATMSLPERAQEGRNYDYRYAWIRDQCFVGLASANAYPDLLDCAVRFVTERLHDDGPHLAPAYTVTGQRVPDERTLHLPGYPGGADVTGNWVNQQFQLDAFGEALQLFAAADAVDRLDAAGGAAAVLAPAALAPRRHEPDAGIWELDPSDWTHSRLSCAAGLRAVARRPRARGQGSRWETLADVIVSDTARVALHPSGRWQRSPSDERIDAALLLAGIRGALASGDPRSASTLRAVLDDLTEDGYAYRFRHGDEPLNRAEGAFLLCGFLVSLSLLDEGDVVGAARWFERNRAACGPPGLYTEEFDVSQRQLRGNLPQAFVHALLIECAHRIADVL